MLPQMSTFKKVQNINGEILNLNSLFNKSD